MTEKYKINGDKFNELCDYIRDFGFESDGCFCGDIDYQLEGNLYLSVYRSCWKSSNCPSGFNWYIFGPTVYNDIDDEEFEIDEQQFSTLFDLLEEASNKEYLERYGWGN